MALLTVIIATIIMSIIGLGAAAGGYWFWLNMKPKKMTWKAKIYQIGDGVIELEKNKKGQPISNLKLKDLKEYATDTLERDEKDKGIIVFKLLRLNKTVPEVTADCVENWGNNNKEVAILLKGETCTLLKKGYDVESGNMIFRPLPYDKVNMVINQMSIRKDRLQKDKNILAEILPIIAIILSLLALVGLTYINGQAHIQVSKNSAEMQKHNDDALVEASENYKAGLLSYGIVQKETVNLGKQDIPTIK